MNVSKEEQSLPVTFASDEDMLQEFRKRNLMLLGWVTLPFLVPFAIINFIQGRHLLGTLTTIVSIIAVVNAVSIKKYHRNYI